MREYNLLPKGITPSLLYRLMKILIDKLDIIIDIKDENIINNNVNNILRSIRISLKRNYNISFESYLKYIF